MTSSKTFLVAVPVAVLAGILAIAAFVAPAEKPGGDARPSPVPVTQSTLSCSLLEQETDLALGQAVARDTAETTAEQRPGGAAIDDLTGTPGWLQSTIDPDEQAGVVVRRDDPQGAGTVAYSAGEASGGLGGGRVLEQCPGPESESWFVGAGSTPRHSSTIRLSNLGESVAVVDVQMYGEEGAVASPDGTGITLEPEEVRSIDLADLAAGENELAVRVVSQRGAVASSILDSSTSVFSGTEWIGQTAAPSRRQAITAIASGATGRTLLLTNPGDDSASVTVNVAGEDGTSVLEGLDEVSVPAGAVKAVELPDSTGAAPIGLRLDSSSPIVGSVRSSSDNSDFGYAVSGEAVDDTAVVPLALGGSVEPGDISLIATPQSQDSPTTMEVEAFDESSGSLGTTEVELPAGETSTFDPSDDVFDSGDIAYLLVRPLDPVYAGFTVTRGDDLSAVGLRNAPLEVLAPDVRPKR